MATSVAEAFITLRADTSGFGKDLKGKLGGALGVASKAFAAIGAAAVGGAAMSVKAFAGLEKGMNEVFTLLPGISGDAMDDMTGQVKDFAKDFGVLPNDVVPALYQSLSAGVPQDNVFAFLETAQKAAKGGVTDLTTAVDGISSVVNAYGEDVIDATKASDLMFTAVRLGKTNFEELSGSLFNVIPTAAALGVEFGDVTAALAQMTAQGVPTSVATTQLRQLFVELSKAGGDAAEAFEHIAGESFQEFIAEGGNVADALDVMQEAADANGVQLQDMFGSVEAGAAALALAGEDTAAFSDTIAEMANSAGATETAFEQMDQGLAVAWERIKANAAVFMADIGEKLAPTVERAATGALEAFQGFVDGWDMGSSEIGENVAEIIGGSENMGAKARDAWDKLTLWWEENGPTIKQWLADLRDWVEETGQKIQDWWNDDAKPAIEEFRAALDEHWPKVEAIFESLGRTVGSIAEIFGKEVSNMSSATEEGETSMSEDIGGLLLTLEGLAKTVEKITGAVAGSWDFLAGAVTGDFGRMTTAVDDFTGGKLLEFTTAVSDKIAEVAAFFADMPGEITAALGDLGSLLWNSGRDVVQGFIDGVASKFEAVRTKLQELTSMLPSWKGPESVDKALLRGPAFDIMEGFAADLWRAANVEVMPTLQRITGEMGRPAMGATVATARAAKHYHLAVNSSHTDTDIVEQFRRMELLHA